MSKDQGHCIGNIDELALILDDTTNGKGGQPAMGFYNPQLASCPTHSTHKSSYHATLVAGTFASGEKMPEHFQIPTDAKELDNQGFYIEFIEDMLETNASYFFKETKQF